MNDEQKERRLTPKEGLYGGVTRGERKGWTQRRGTGGGSFFVRGDERVDYYSVEGWVELETRSTNSPFLVHTSVRLIGVAHSYHLWSLHGPRGKVENLMACHRPAPRADVLARICFI